VVSDISVPSSDRDLQAATLAINDDLNYEAVGELAPHFTQPTGLPSAFDGWYPLAP
jgi:hypothetical protein